jgi:hypothetical protein
MMALEKVHIGIGIQRVYEGLEGPGIHRELLGIIGTFVIGYFHQFYVPVFCMNFIQMVLLIIKKDGGLYAHSLTYSRIIPE